MDLNQKLIDSMDNIFYPQYKMFRERGKDPKELKEIFDNAEKFELMYQQENSIIH